LTHEVAQLAWKMNDLGPEKALIFRITHIDNMPWMLINGLHCRNSPDRDPNFVEIGNRDLIGKRASRVVPIHPGGTLSDYIPFYFTPCSPMLLNIKTGSEWGTAAANGGYRHLGGVSSSLARRRNKCDLYRPPRIPDRRKVL